MRGSLFGPRRVGLRPRRGGGRPRVERLEERQLLATFTVTNTGDINANGTTVPGSLRDAIEKANAAGGQNTINFSIGTGLQTISPSKPLPVIVDPMTIDGTTQPGFSSTPVIQINGALAGGTAIGLQVSASNTTIKGLAINRFGGDGVQVSAGGVTLLGDFIGVDPTGTAALGNGGHGVFVNGAANVVIGATGAGNGNVISGNKAGGIILFANASSGDSIVNNFIGTDLTGKSALGNQGDGVTVLGGNFNVIGGTASGQGNIISGNTGNGVTVQGASNTSVQGNIIGAGAQGTTAVGNQGAGILLLGSNNNVIGGPVAGARNVISGNAGRGMLVQGSNNNTIQNNLIGVGSDGTSSLGNGAAGIFILGSNGNSIGGTQARTGNVIAFNGNKTAEGGVDLFAGTGNSILGNSIFSQVHSTNPAKGIGIDLGDDGVTPNTPGGPHTGPNNLQNFPVLTNVVTGAGRTLIQGTLNSAPNTTFRVEFFSNPAADPTGFGEGQTFLGSTTVTTDSNGNATINDTLTTPVQVGQFVSATATDPGNNTSEFAADVKVGQATVSDLAVAITSSPNPATLNSNFTYTVTITNAGPNAATNVVLTDTLPSSVTFVSGTVDSGGSFTQTGTKFTANIPTLAVGATATATIVVNPTAVGTVTDTAVVSSGQIDPDTSNNTASEDTRVDIPADLGVTVTASPSPVVEGGTLTYKIIVTNNGPGQASNVVVTQQLPAGATFVSASPGQGTFSPPANGVLNVSLGSVAPGSAVATIVVVTAGQAGIPPNQVTADTTVDVTGDQIDPDLTNNEAKVSVPVLPSADLAVTVAADPSPVLANSPLTYTVAVTNNGPDPATNVSIVDILPTGVTLDGAPTIDTGGTIASATDTGVNATVPEIDAGATATLTIVVIPSAPGSITNAVTVTTADDVDINPANNSATATTQVSPADVGVAITATPNPATAGADLTFRISVTNAGIATATNVKLLDRIPANAQVISANSDVGTVQPISNGTLEVDIPSLDAGLTATIFLVVRPSTSTVLVDSASVTADEADPNPANNSASLSVPVSPADLVATVAATPQPVLVGTPLTITATVTNNGPAIANGVILAADLPAGVIVASPPQASQGSAGVFGSTATVNVGTLLPGASATLTIVVTPTAVGTLNITTRTAAAEFDPNTDNNAASTQVTAFNQPGAFVLASPTLAVAQNAGTATITVERVGGTLGQVMVNFAVFGGTAVPGVDYVPVAGTLVFNDGQTSQTITVPILDNGQIGAADRVVGVLLGGPTGGATLGPVAAAALTIVNVHPDVFGPIPTDTTLGGDARAITTVTIAFNKALDPTRASNPANYTLIAPGVGRSARSAASGNQVVPVNVAFYNPLNNTVTLVPSRPLPAGAFNELIVNGSLPNGLMDQKGNLLDGAGNGVNGTNYVITFARGASLTYGDAGNNVVNLRLSGGGVLDLVRGADGQGSTLRLLGAVPGRSTLSGSVRASSFKSTGVTSFREIDGLVPFGAIKSRLTTPPFFVTDQPTTPTVTAAVAIAPPAAATIDGRARPAAALSRRRRVG
jgi:uncharacterized repeat protein (TIGR01451 family)